MKVHHTRVGPGGRRRKLIAGALGMAVLLVGALTGAAVSAGSSASAASNSTLRVASDTQITTFNPFLSYYDGELAIIGNIYPSLTSIDEQGKPIPYLADSWTTSPDKLTWTFKIHPGLKWSDGKPITAADAAWTFNLIMHNSVAATSNGSLVANFAKVTAPDATTLVITTKKPQANMLYLSIPVSGIAIVPQHIWQSHVNDLKAYRNMDFPVVGYGPWILSGNVTNQYATLKANKSFFLGAPGFDTLISQYFSNSDAAVAALRSGQLDQIGGLTAPQFGALKSESNITTYQQNSSGWTALEINSGAKTRTGKPMGTGNPILADPTVREAIALAINRQELVRKVLDGDGVSGAGYLPPGYPQWWWQPSAGDRLDYNPAKANQILDAAGYTKGSDGIRTDPQTGKPLNFRFGIHSDDAGDAAIAPYIQEWLKAVGIGTTVQPMSFDQLNVNLSKGDWDMLMDGWSTGADPTYLLSIQTCATLPLDDGTSGNTDAFYLQPGVRQAVQPAGHGVRPGTAVADRRPDAGHPLQGECRHHPLLQERSECPTQRPGEQLPVRRAGQQGLLPAPEPVHQLADGEARVRRQQLVEYRPLDRPRGRDRGGRGRGGCRHDASPLHCG